jgi:hypothetical protein
MMYNTSKKAFDKIYVQAVAYFRSLNQILKVRNFAIHSEFKEDNGSLVPVEMNTMRFGGMGLGNMGYYAIGLNSYACFLNDTEPDWEKVWQGREEDVFSYFIAYNATRANYLLKWEAIRLCREKGFTEYDMYGIPHGRLADAARKPAKILLRLRGITLTRECHGPRAFDAVCDGRFRVALRQLIVPRRWMPTR